MLPSAANTPGSPALPAWKRHLGDPAAVTPAAAPRVAPSSFGREPARPRPGAPAPMALQFELRELTPHTAERWRGPTARTVSRVEPGHGSYRLGVRALFRNARGTWVRADLSWSKLSTQARAHNLDLDQHRWFCEFVAVYRALRGVYYSQETDWLYLDDFTSPLLWHLLAEGARLGVTWRGTSATARIDMAQQAALSLDVTATESADGSDLLVTTRLSIDGTARSPEFAAAIGTHGLYTYCLDPTTVFTLAATEAPLSVEQRRLLGRPATVTVPGDDAEEFLTEHYPRLRAALTVTSTDASVRFPEIVPALLVLTARFGARHRLTLAWSWDDTAGTERHADAERELLGRVGILLVAPDPADSAPDPGPAPDPGAPTVPAPALPAPASLRGLATAEFTEKTLPQVRALRGVRVDVIGEEPTYRELTEVPELTVTTVETDQRDWFDLGVIVTVSGVTVPFTPLFSALATGKTRLLLVDNSYLSLRQPVFDRLRDLLGEARALSEWDSGLRISRHQASLWSDFEDLADQSRPTMAWREAVDGLLALSDPARAAAAPPTPGGTPVPSGVNATLRHYQLEGFHWLAYLYAHRLGGILADDMGLGKTLQALTLIAHAVATDEASNAQPRRAFLVVAPTSVVSNWSSEAARFTPGLRVRAITAATTRSGASVRQVADGADVVITSYALFRLHFAQYQEQPWAGLILDEAQFLKNRGSKVHECARDLDAPFKLAITGTPMENSVMDLWSLLRIVAPGLFPSARRFTEQYLRPLERGPRPELLARLRRRIRPLMLRRTKEVVAAELPAKQEQVLRVDLAPAHQKLYDTFLQRERQKLLGLMEDMDANRFIIFRSLTLLRLLSLDASLVDEAYAGLPSSKLDVLLEQLDDVVAEGHRALIFSQFTSYLALAAARLRARGIAYCYLDGSTTERAAVIDSFKTGTAPVFLISLKAGGFGLNLTEADYVFLLDPWWNPATEAQAVDRTHRIGQTRTVLVYRMVASGTIEEKVMALKAQKAELFGAVMNEEAAFSSALTSEDLRGLLEP